MPVFDYLGNEYETIREMCKAYNISERIYSGRVNKLKWDKKKALTTPPKRRCVAVTTKNGQSYSSIRQAAIKNNITHTTVKNRLSHGWSLDDALNQPVKQITNPVTDHNGIEYPSLEAVAKAYNVSPGTLKGRLERGWDIKKALLAPVRKAKPYFIGEKVVQRNGQIAELVSLNKRKGTFRFEDGTIVKDVSITEFRRGNIKNPNHKSCIAHIGEEVTATCGLKMKIIDIKTAKDITVQFEDKTIRSGISYWSFIKGKVSHPTFCADTTRTGTFMGFKVRALPRINSDLQHYEAEDLKTGERDILTPQQMIELAKLRLN